MRHIQRILVAIKDPRANSTPALVKAGQLARATGAQVELFHGITEPLFVDGYGIAGKGLTAIEHSDSAKVLVHLEKMAERLRRTHTKVSIATEWDYPSYEAIVRRAVKTKADLIVADQHAGRHTVAGLLHLADWELLRLSPIPVLLTKSPGTYKRPVVLAALDPGHTFSKPANLDQGILRAGATITRALRGTLHGLHAYPLFPLVYESDVVIDKKAVDRVEKAAAATARKALDRAIGSTRITKTNRHVIGADPASAIAQTARKLKSAIVVMGAVSRSGLKSLFIGNTAEKVLDLLDCDILVIKPERFVGRVSHLPRGVKLVTLPSAPFPV
ncbi:MAG: universal stress protein [Steroidobacteraceae bacterium]